jgi:excisionase family DNA binding protein
MNITECAEYLGIATDTLYLYARRGDVPAFRLGNRWKFKKTLIDTWISQQCDQNTGASRADSSA